MGKGTVRRTQMPKSSFNTKSVAYGLRDGEFSELPEKTKKKLVKLMARLSEQAYRRGFQQGHTLGGQVYPRSL
jgi:hypothetical protein